MDRQFNKSANNFLGTGWSFPVTFTAGNHQLNTTSAESNVNASIDIIMYTRKGERCLEPRFGLGLQQFFFRTMDETLKGEIADAVKTSLLHNEPRITVKNVQVDFTDPQNGWIEVNVTYMLNQTNTRHNYVFPFHLKEGTNLVR